MQKICVLGAGSWGTALAKILAEKGYFVFLWVHSPNLLKTIISQRENPERLPGFLLPDRVIPTGEFLQAAQGAEMVLCVVPSHAVRQVISQITPFLPANAFIISASKGIENDTLLTVSQIIRSIVPESLHSRIGVLSGPSFALEVVKKIPTAIVLASETKEIKNIQHILSTPSFRVYTSRDIIGVELGGALKNVIAIAAGACDGLGLGHNTRAALMTRGIAEVTRLGRRMGANPLTFSGLAGLGDLILTCTSDLSRNRQVGIEIGQGKKLSEILAGMKTVAEGVLTTRSAFALSQKLNVDMPLTEQVYRVLYEGKSPQQALHDLMTRTLKPELEEEIEKSWK